MFHCVILKEKESVCDFLKLFTKMNTNSTLDDHSKTIVHLDIDCFYAQVEMVKNPALESVPLGIQQKNFVVTSNYVARKCGVKKGIWVPEAKKICPGLVLVNGEDLHDYRQISYKVTSILQTYSSLVERLGLDENYVDVSELVTERLNDGEPVVVGNIFDSTSDVCDCGCYFRLSVGSQIAQEMRDKIKNDLKLTTSGGIAHNKLLAKLVGSKHKPDQQTVIFPNSAVALMMSLPAASSIPGIGFTLAEQLNKIKIATVEDIQNANLSMLSTVVGSDKAKHIYDMSFGIDRTPVKPTGKPQSIGIEDSCVNNALSVDKEVRDKFLQLLTRLLILVAEDGRMPKTIKVTVRKFNKNNSSRESRQCNINPAIFNSGNITNLSEANINKIITIIMRLFNKLVDVKKPYHLTLLGLAFTKFLERPTAKGTLGKFLVKRDIEVQSVTNIESFSESVSTPDVSSSTSYSENSESDVESTAKRPKYNLLAKKRLFKDFSECDSPSKLRVADLRLNSTDSPTTDTNQNIKCPPNADESVFWELPKDVQQELWEEYRRSRREYGCINRNEAKKMKPNTILNYFVKS